MATNGLLSSSFLVLFTVGVLSALVTESFGLQLIPKEKPFLKLNLTMPLIPVSALNKDVTFARKVSEEQMSPELLWLKGRHGMSDVSYSQLDEDLMQLVFSVIPGSLLVEEVPSVEWQVITGERKLIPHIDQNRISAINFYVSVHGETTVFYSNPTNEYVIPGLKNKVFDHEWITAGDSFVAEQGDVYLLDVSTIHSVENLSPTEPRVTVTCGFNLPFHEVQSYFL